MAEQTHPMLRPLPDGIVPEEVVARTERHWLTLMVSMLILMLVVVVLTSALGALHPASNVEVIQPLTLHLGGEFAESNLGTAIEPDGSATVRIIAEQYDLGEWKSLYELAKLFDVTISALCVRLAHLGLSYVDENGHLQAPPAVPAPAHNNNSHYAPLPQQGLPRRKAAPQQARRHLTPIPVATTTKTNRESVNPR